MEQKVKFFRNEHLHKLEEDINTFAKDHIIKQISYSTNTIGYSVHHYCCVLYADK